MAYTKKRKIVLDEVHFISGINADFAYAAVMELWRCLQMDESEKNESFSLAIQVCLTHLCKTLSDYLHIDVISGHTAKI